MSDRVDAQMLADWRINYNLVGRTPAEAMRWWHDHMDGMAPAGVVAALGLCINEIERLTAERNALRDDNAKLNGWVEGEAQAAGRLQRKLNAAEEANERLAAERSALRRQLAEAEQDARRYRWLRDTCPSADKAPDVWHALCQKPGTVDQLLNRVADLDTAIDSAMGASNE